MRTVHGIDHGWNGEVHPERRDAIRAWLRRNGVDPCGLRNVRLVGEGRIEVERYAKNTDGELLVVDDEPATTTVTVEISEPPPAEWWDDTRSLL